MTRSLAIGLAFLVALPLLMATVAEGQVSFKVGVSGGGTVPLGTFGDLNDAGFNFAAHGLISSPFFPQDFKIEVQHNRMNLDPGPGRTLVTSGTLNLEWNFGSAIATVSPYLSAGLGGYHVQTALRGATPATTRYGNTTKFGLNAGGGLRFGLAGFNAFVEARVHRVRSDTFVSGKVVYLPIAFGLTL
jgi:hypothetical protein